MAAAFLAIPVGLAATSQRAIAWTAWEAVLAYGCFATAIFCGVAEAAGWPFPLLPLTTRIVHLSRYVRHPRLGLAALANKSPVVWRGLPGGHSSYEGWVSPDVLQAAADVPAIEPREPTPSWEELNRVRVGRYAENRGLFLVHEWWTPSQEPGQVADVTIRLEQHGEGPLSRGEIRAVEYTLGPRFINHSLVPQIQLTATQ